ncbi:ABC transporter permease [Lentisphaerota bacterium ZTH]|nr:ABC transporter permease [Lentisphaerota bacterium]WET05660.1 ABC transporter permease [Lentisphaerota bacterium ZTH]
MNFKTELFLAKRYLRPKRNAVSVITCISIVGVALGVAVLIVVLAVMTGFTDIMKDKLLQTQAHLHVYSGWHSFIRYPERVIKKIEECGGEGAAVVNRPALIQLKNQFVPKAVFGINPDQIVKHMDFKGVLKKGKLALGKNEAVISTDIAQELDLRVGDKLLIHSPQRLSNLVKVKQGGGVSLRNPDEVYLPAEFTVTGLYSFGKYDFDKNVIFVGLEDADELFNIPWGSATTVYGWVKDPFNIEPVADKISKDLPGMYVLTWKQINRQLLGVLSVEKNMMFFLLIFIVLVAAFSITNTLITVVIQKTREIGLLKALGASSGTVMRIFILQGMFVGLLGSIFGTLLGIAVVFYRNDLNHFLSRIRGQDLFPRQFYYFNELPGHIVASDVAVIVIVAIILCTLGGLIPAWRAAKLDPAKALRNE